MSYSGVKRLAEERPDWILIIKECLECAQKYKEFATSWVLSGLEEKTKKKVWRPGLRILSGLQHILRPRTHLFF